VSEISITRKQAGAHHKAKTSRRNAPISRGLVANLLSPEEEKRTIRASEVQIGNSG